MSNINTCKSCNQYFCETIGGDRICEHRELLLEWDMDMAVAVDLETGKDISYEQLFARLLLIQDRLARLEKLKFGP